MQSPTTWKDLRADRLSVTLKFGFHQRRVEYSVTNVNSSIVQVIYCDAEKWLREMASNCKNGQLIGSYIIYLFRIPVGEATMIPIIHSIDVEQMFDSHTI